MCKEIWYVVKEDLLWEDGEFMATVLTKKPRQPYLIVKKEYDPDGKPGTVCGTVRVYEPTIIGACRKLAEEEYVLPANGISGVPCSVMAKARNVLLADPKTHEFIRKHNIFILSA